MDSMALIRQAVQILDKKKAEGVRVIDVSELTDFTEYFIIAGGTSSTHVRSLADELEEGLKNAGFEPRGVEGRSAGWILLDYYSVIIHVFTPSERDYYDLERLWKDGKYIDVPVGEAT